jgi:hypothetical protein
MVREVVPSVVKLLSARTMVRYEMPRLSKIWCCIRPRWRFATAIARTGAGIAFITDAVRRELAVTAVTRKVVVRVGGQCDVRAGALCKHRDGRRRRGELPSGERTVGSVAEHAPRPLLPSKDRDRHEM